MSQSPSPSLTEENLPSPTPLFKGNASDASPVDDLPPDLDGEVSAARGADLAIPQKREREVSLEAATPYPDDTAEQGPATLENRSSSPVKKSRALSTPVEVDENDNEEQQDGDFVFVDASEVPAPSPQPSPPHETKVRQISQGVEDIGWRNDQNTLQESGDIIPVHTAPDNAAPPDPQSQTGTSSPTSVATTPEFQNQADIGQVCTGDVGIAAQMGEATATATATASVEPDAAPPPATVPAATEELLATSSANRVSQRMTEHTHVTDDQNKLPFRNQATREDSNSPEIKRPTPPLSEIDGATKRPREDEDGDLDPNPREAKRASPPPEKDKDKDKKERPSRKKSGADTHTLSAPASPRSRPASVFGGGGFLAYASMGSPFAAVKGPTLFGASSTQHSTITTITTTTTTPTTTSNAATILTTAPSVPNSPPKTVPSSPVQRAASPTPAKRTGFEAFASAASPFTSVAARARSPVRRSGSPGPGAGVRSNPFALYAAGGTQGLFSASGAPAAKRARGDSESIAPGEGGESSSWREGSAGAEKTFGERLRAGSGSGGDEEDEAEGGVWGEAAGGKWAEQEVLTGEEEDETVHSVRGKLFILSEQNQWKERGTGLLRLNRRRVDRGGARLVMRKDAVYAVMLNVTLFRGMSCSIAQDPRYLRFSMLTPSGTTHYNLRVGSAQAAVDLLKAINDNIPRT
ncbi:hypothetical protein BJV78DRAFT_90903 [Lactifluus subvellereus]|nr:hypothetical protein BJV78DRAFT_90903 [Lactifluus subvellereus]